VKEKQQFLYVIALAVKRYYNWEYFRIKTVGNGFVVVQNQKLEIFRWNNNNQTIFFFQREVLNI
jgi:hypothetical protein